MTTQTPSRSGSRIPAARITALLSTLLVAAALFLAPPATAHDVLLESSPSEGETVTAPEEIALTFSANILEIGAVIEVDGPSGSVIVDEVQIEGPVATQQLQPDLEPGDYTTVWRVTSSDGHPISGTFSFTVEQDVTTEDPTTTEPDVTTAPPGTEDPTDGAGATAPETDAPGTEDPTGVTETEAGTETDTETGTGTDTETATAVPTPSEAEDAEADDDAGIPTWGWVLIAIAVLGLAALVMIWSRRANAGRGAETAAGRPSDEADPTAR